MQPVTREKIQFMKLVLEEDPFYLVIGDIQEESDPDPDVKKDALQTYHEFLNEYSSLRCGSVIFFGRKELPDYQFPVADMPGGFEEWVCIGKIEPYPLYINKQDGRICCLTGDPGTEMKIRHYGEFQEFMESYVFGEKYVEIGGRDDWYDLMKQRGLLK
ncbi:hypothetical protein [Paenibacillus oleatilyticus]|uniref:Knr4/Smi1-like domain-containing protein n=1 Tax=Paenibacillus oleatilyticus TaxID=2594886 RepID=A0ABV4V083_9BACL